MVSKRSQESIRNAFKPESGKVPYFSTVKIVFRTGRGTARFIGLYTDYRDSNDPLLCFLPNFDDTDNPLEIRASKIRCYKVVGQWPSNIRKYIHS